MLCVNHLIFITQSCIIMPLGFWFNMWLMFQLNYKGTARNLTGRGKWVKNLLSQGQLNIILSFEVSTKRTLQMYSLRTWCIVALVDRALHSFQLVTFDSLKIMMWELTDSQLKTSMFKFKSSIDVSLHKNCCCCKYVIVWVYTSSSSCGSFVCLIFYNKCSDVYTIKSSCKCLEFH